MIVLSSVRWVEFALASRLRGPVLLRVTTPQHGGHLDSEIGNDQN